MSRCKDIFLDEFDNFDFIANGTRYWVLTSVSMQRLFDALIAVDDLKRNVIENGYNFENFQRDHDRGLLRNSFFETITRHFDTLIIDSLVVEKASIDKAQHEVECFYPTMPGQLLP